jgi:hypothetical protein
MAQTEFWPAFTAADPGEEHYAAENENRNTVSLAANNIREFISSPKKPKEYADFIAGFLKKALGLPPENKIWELLAHLEGDTDFYTAPASTRYHGAEPCGLIRHSLLVLANGIHLAPLMLGDETDNYYLAVSCLFHDLCKVGMYEQKMRNVKNEKTGEWEREPFYTFRSDYLAFGHGIESLLRISRFIELPPSWSHAVRWHMGAYDISPSDKFCMEKALGKYREVLLLQTADMQAGLVEAV